MRHTWQKLPDVESFGHRHFKWLCKVCGCEKLLGNYKFATPRYDRNGQLYDRYIECIDEEAEKLKTID